MAAIGGRVGAVQVGEAGQTITTVVLAAIANPIVAVGAMAGTLAGAMVHNGVAVDGRRARFAVTGGLVRLWGRASHLVRVVSAGLTDQHSVIVVLVVAACILETCVPCMPDGRNNHL